MNSGMGVPFAESVSAFQGRAIQLLDELRAEGVQVGEVGKAGEHETYLRTRLAKGSLEVELYLYEDEAGYFLEGRWIPFEEQDYEASSELLSALGKSLRALMGSAAPEEGA